MEKRQHYTKKSIAKLAFPFLLYIAFIVTMHLHKSTTAIYFNMVYYWSLGIFYVITKKFSFKNLWSNWKTGKNFWLAVVLTFLAMIVAYAIGMVPGMLFNIDDGMVAYRLDGALPVFLFGITLIPLPSIVEESFFRLDIINLQSKKSTIITAIIGVILFGFSHTLNTVGALTAMLWGIPLTVSYIKTKNIYIPITAHLMSNVLMNGMSVISAAIQLAQHT